jgi:hypothetical protein
MHAKACQSLKASEPIMPQNRQSHKTLPGWPGIAVKNYFSFKPSGVCFKSPGVCFRSRGGRIPGASASREGLIVRTRPPARDGRVAGDRYGRIRSCRSKHALLTRSGRPGPAGAQRRDFLIGGEPSGLLLREQKPTVDGDLEHAAHPGYQLDIGTVKLNQARPRTEGPRLIVSRLAPLDSNLHLHPPSRLLAAKISLESVPRYLRACQARSSVAPRDRGGPLRHARIAVLGGNDLATGARQRSHCLRHGPGRVPRAGHR